MSYSASFLDNQTLGVDDFNNIVARLMRSGGVLDFTHDGTYSAAKMNDATAAATSRAGVVPDSETSMRVSLYDGKILVEKGTAVFPSGVVLTITETEHLARTSGAQYVYLRYSVAENTAQVLASESLPTDGSELVELCHISAAGALTDMRVYAVGRLAASATWNGTRKQTFSYAATAETSGGGRESVTQTLLLDGDRVNFLLFQTDKTLSLVTEPQKGVFEIFCVVGWDTGASIVDFVWLNNQGNGVGTQLRNFRREDGILKYDYFSYTSGSCTLYTSVYSEEA